MTFGSLFTGAKLFDLGLERAGMQCKWMCEGGFRTEPGEHIVSFSLASDPNNWTEDAVPPITGRHGDPGNVAYALTAPNGGGRSQERNIATGMIVRRLTPTECLRLMGALDSWLDLDPPLSDSAKYRLCGNGVVVPVAEWIGRRIMLYFPTVHSLTEQSHVGTQS